MDILKKINGSKILKNKRITHFCKIPNNLNREIEKGINFPLEKEDLIMSNRYGIAIDYCYGFDGKLLVSNGEYENEVYFCPFCGKNKDFK